MKLSRGDKRLFVLSTLVIGLPLGIGLWLNYLNATPTVSISPYPTAPKPNGTDLYGAAGAALVVAKPAVDSLLDDFPPNEDARAKRYNLTRRLAWLRANQTAFALFDRAQQTPSLATSLRHNGGTKWRIKALSQMARAKRVEVHARRMQRDWNGAFESGLDGIQMGHDLRRGGGLWHSRFGQRIGDDSRLEIHDLVNRLNPSQAQNAARRMEDLLAGRWSEADSLREEKSVVQTLWLDGFQSEDWRSGLSNDSAPCAWPSPRAYLVSKQRIVDISDAEFDRQIALARLPYARKSAPAAPTNWLTDIFADGAEQTRFADARDLAGDQLLLLQLALRAHYLQNGAYPATLNELAPRYLKAIPADPFGAGEPMRYKRNGASYVLWSIGPDEKDDGGTPIPPNPDEMNLRAPDSGEAARLPGLLIGSQGDFVAGKNRARGFEWPRID